MNAGPLRYQAFGLQIESALPLPELWPAASSFPQPDVTIRRGTAPRPASVAEIVPDVHAGPRRFWMQVPEVGRLGVEKGVAITLDPEPGRDEELKAFLLGSGFGALLHQRNMLPLHASAVRVGEKAVAFLGSPGAGKSTLAVHLSRGGEPFLCDDICALADMAGTPVLSPGLRVHKLWGDALAAMEVPAAGLAAVTGGIDKYKLPAAVAEPPAAAELGLLVVLARGERTAVRPLSGSEAAGAVIANTFRGELVGPMGRQAEHFRQCVELAGRVPVVRLERAWGLDRIGEGAALLRDHLERLSN